MRDADDRAYCPCSWTNLKKNKCEQWLRKKEYEGGKCYHQKTYLDSDREKEYHTKSKTNQLRSFWKPVQNQEKLETEWQRI